MSWYKISQFSNVLNAARSSGYIIQAYHGGSFNIEENSVFEISGFGVHFGTYDAAEYRIGSAPVDHYIEEMEVEEFEGSWYFSIAGYDDETPYDSEDEARAAGEKAAVEMGNNSDLYYQNFITSVYLKLENPIKLPDLGTWAISDIIRNLPEKAKFSNVELDMINKSITSGEYGNEWELLREILISKGFDGVIYRNMVEGKPANSYIIFKSSQVKSSDEVTYDDSGNPIPLSDRFDSENPDIRY